MGLCLNLGVDKGIMDFIIHSDDTMQVKKLDCLKAYCNSGVAKWSEVVQAVAKYPINNRHLAKRIAQVYGAAIDTEKLGDEQYYRSLTDDKIENLEDLIQAVADVSDWMGLCRNLGVDEGRMYSIIDSDNIIQTKKSYCLKAYFNSGTAKWSEVIEAVANYPINNRHLAKKIARYYDTILKKDEL